MRQGEKKIWGCSNGYVIFVADVDNAVYDISKESPVSYLKGNKEEVEEYISKIASDDEDILLNYQTYSVSADDNYLYVIYKYQNKNTLINVFDKDFKIIKTIDITNLDFIKKLPKYEDGGSVQLYKNKLYVKYRSKGKYLISVSEIKI